MAGSWGHITDEQGRFAGTRLIENLGDAYEALEQCYGMIVWLAEMLAAEDYHGERRAIIAEAEKNYKHGLGIGGRNERDR